MNRNNGFTLIELVMVIVIIGILAAVAIPKFIDLSSKAGLAGVSGVAGGVSSASGINLSACKAGSASCTPMTGTVNCSAVVALLAGGLPTGYTTTGSVNLTASGSTGTCVITNTATGQTANATAFSTT